MSVRLGMEATPERYVISGPGAAASDPSIVMAGLDPASSTAIAIGPAVGEVHRMRGGWIYFMTNRRDGVLYVGVTSDLPRRAWEHREGVAKGFTKRYQLQARP